MMLVMMMMMILMVVVTLTIDRGDAEGGEGKRPNDCLFAGPFPKWPFLPKSTRL
jgi:hypothetical protein